MVDPYETPKTREVYDEQKLKGGFLASSDAKAVECFNAWFSLEKRYLRVRYLPRKSRNLVLILFCISVVVMVPLAVVGGLGAIILYAVINTAVTAKNTKNIEFDLDDESLIVDVKRKRIGLKKVQHGKAFFIGIVVSKNTLAMLLENFAYTEEPVKKGSRFFYQLIAVGVWIAGVVLGFQFLDFYL